MLCKSAPLCASIRHGLSFRRAQPESTPVHACSRLQPAEVYAAGIFLNTVLRESLWASVEGQQGGTSLRHITAQRPSEARDVEH